MAGLNVVILCNNFGFPHGTGAAARTVSYALGLKENGANVHVLCLTANERNDATALNREVSGVFKGIPFEYTCGQTAAGKTRACRAWLVLKGLWRAVWAIRRIHRTTPVNAILLYYGPHGTAAGILAGVLARWLGAVLIGDKSEFPFVGFRRTLRVQFSDWMDRRVTYRLVDILIVISTYLQEYFLKYVRKDAHLLRLPIMVDLSSFPESLDKTDGQKKTVVYCGNLDHEGEIDNLLRTFSVVAKDFPDWQVNVIGYASNESRMRQLRELVTDLGLEGKANFLGYVARQEVPAHLCAGDVMVLPRASGIFSLAGFPTKLGEYLATGKPTVVTATGDIPRYLEDGVSAYLVRPDEMGEFADHLRFVMSHPTEAAAVGRRGREVAAREFDYRMNCRRIIDVVDAVRVGKRSIA